MEKTIIELFAGVGGFRVGFEQASKEWKTVWANQWEPNKKTQHAFDCYSHHFAKKGGVNKYSNVDVAKVPTDNIPNHTLLVGGFPCQDYSVAGTKTKGIEGKKGVLWWEIKKIITEKRPSFILLENVDRLIKSPASQRGRDFGVMLACLNELGYGVEWRVINAEDYGLQQRRRRVFIFAFDCKTNYYTNFCESETFYKASFFNRIFPVSQYDQKELKSIELPSDIVKISDKFHFSFENSGYMLDGIVKTIKPTAIVSKKTKSLYDMMEDEVSGEFFIKGGELDKFTYLKGSKREERVSNSGFKYMYTEGAIPFPDILDRPARTLLTSESSINRSTHIVKDKKTGELRKLTPVECERINGFPDNWTNTGMPQKFRYFCMGNALVVDLITMIAKELGRVIDKEN